MFNMTKVRSPRSEKPGMADSLSRMLELEKQYKMQRAQDNGSSHTIPPGPIDTRPSPSTLSDLSLRVRRASAQPPPSHNMKAARRSSGLPSLSISIPPSPTSTQGARGDKPPPTDKPNLVVESRKEPGERMKMVTFSGTEEDGEEDLSDVSSICHSPSWEGFGQSSKKKAQKREKKEKKKLEEKAAKAAKKQSNRLNKGHPQDTQRVQALKASDRSVSAPELEQHAKINPRNLIHSTGDISTETMANHGLNPQPPGGGNVKAKSKGFLASFRNSSAGPKKTAARRNSVDEAQSNHNSVLAGPPSHMHNTAGPGSDHDFINARQEASNKFNGSGSTQSLSSQERRPGLGRQTSSSGQNGRNMSLLSRFKGSSYLYSHGSNSEVKEDKPRPPLSRSALSSIEAMPAPQHNPRLASTLALSQKMEGPPDNGEMRGRQPTTHLPRPRDSSSDYEEFNPIERRDRRLHVSGYPSAPQQPVANEGRRRPHSYNVQTKPRNGEFEPEKVGDHATGSQKNQARELNAGARRGSSSQRPARESEGQVQHPEQVEKQPGEQSKFDSYASTPAKKWSPSPSVIGRAVSHDDETGNTTESRTQQRPSKVEMSSDYFAFISESYAPPSLELRSPFEGKMSSSPRIDEASDDKESHDKEEHSWSRRVQSIEISRGTATQTVAATGPDPTMLPISVLGSPPIVISPAISAEQSDSDVPAFEHLGDAAHETNAVETHYQPQCLQEERSSGSTSERSSSSTNEEVHHLTSAMTTPNSSRPHSRRGHSVEAVSRSTVKSALIQPDERATQKAPIGDNSHPTHPDAGMQDDSWCRTALPFDQDDQSVMSARWSRLDASTPSLVGTPSSTTFADEPKEGVEETIRLVPESPPRQTLPPKAHSAIDLPTTNFLPPLRHQPLNQRKAKLRASTASLPSSPPAELDAEAPALPPALTKSSGNNNSSTSQGPQSPASASAAYLQEARKTAPIHPLSSRALRPVYPPKGTLPPATQSTSPERRGEPLAKVLVECCNCKFFHDMPSRVYECMAKPDSVVEDKLLGVSATITTMVKCPWCAHGMTTQCCSGYAAIVYLTQKLHGK